MSDCCLWVLAHQGLLRESSAEEFSDDLWVHIDGRVLRHGLVQTLDFFSRDLASIVACIDVFNWLHVHQIVRLLDLSLLTSFVEHKADDLCVFLSHHGEFVLIDVVAGRIGVAKADELISALIITAALSSRNKRSVGLGNQAEQGCDLNISSVLYLDKRLFNLLADNPDMLSISLLLNGQEGPDNLFNDAWLSNLDLVCASELSLL